MDEDLAALGLTGHEPPIEYIDGWAVMSRDPITGLIELAYIEEGAGPGGRDLVHLKTVQDCSALLDENKAIRAIQDGKRHGDGLQLKARVPMNVWANRLAEPMLQKDKAHLRRFFNDPDNAGFVVKSGSL